MNDKDYLEHLGIVAYNRKEFEKALKYFTLFSETYPSDPFAWYNLCNLYEEQGSFEKAKEAVLHAIEMDNTISDLHYHLGYVLANESQFKAAACSFQKAIDLEPDYINALYNLGVMQQILKDFEYSKELFLRIIEIDPEYLFAHNNLANLYLREKNMDLAKQELDMALSLCPDDPVIHHTLSVYYSRINNYTEALDEINIAIKNGFDKNVLHRLSKTEILLEMNELDQARNLGMSILRDYPELADVYEVLGKYFQRIQDFNQAISYYQSALQKDGTLIESLLGLREIYTQQQDSSLVEQINIQIRAIEELTT